MIETVKINITPLKTFIGKIVPMNKLELFLFRNYEKPNSREYLDKFYKEVIKETSGVIMREQQFIYLLTVLNKVITRNTPYKRNLLIKTKVIELINKTGDMFLVVEYTYE